MPDIFEVDYGFNPFDPSDANQDADGDGYTNLRESRAGTDPLDPSSTPTEGLPFLGPLLLHD